MLSSKRVYTLWAVALLVSGCVLGAFAQNSLPEPSEDHPKIQVVLEELIANLREGHSSMRLIAEPGGYVLNVNGDQVQVVIEADSEAAVVKIVQRVREAGGKVELTYGALVQALMPILQLELLAELAEVRFIRPPVRPVLDQGQVISEGVRLIGSQAWNNAGLTGQGVKVGIIDSFGGYEALLGRELPPRERVTARSFRADGRMAADPRDIHGTAVAEIIHDIAPESELFLAAFNTDVEFRQAASWLIDQRVHVINTSLSWYSGCFTGPGLFEPTIAQARQTGIIWATTSGNDGARHWEGSWRDDNGNSRHEFSGNDEEMTLEVQLFEGVVRGERMAIAAFSLIFSWEASCSGASDDYDVVIFPEENPSNRGGSDWFWRPGIPIKGAFRTYFWPLSQVGTVKRFSVVIEKKRAAAPPARLDLALRGCSICLSIEYRDARGSVGIGEPRISPNAFTVGAFQQNDLSLAFYSGRGPTKDGRIKPDIAAPSHVSTVSYGRFGGGRLGFTGTSAAAPHVAGAAALVKQAFPNFGPAEVKEFLEKRAEDRGPPGKDNDWGAGQLILGPVPGALTAPKPPTELAATATSPTSIELRWKDDSDNEDGFKIERKLPGADFIQIAQLSANTTSFTDRDLKPATTYCYRVRAFNAAGDSPFSNETCTTTPLALPTAPSELAATAVSPTQIDLRWKDTSDNEEGVKIERKVQGGEFAQIAQVAANVTNFSDTGLSSNTTYVYRVRAFNAAGDSPYSNEASVTTPSALRVLALRSGEPVSETAEPGPKALSLTQYTLDALPGVRQLIVRLRALGNLDLHLRFGKPIEVSEGKVIADASSTGPMGIESLELSGEKLQPGTYYIALENQEGSPQGYVLVGAVAPQIIPVAFDTPATGQLAAVVQTGSLETVQYLIEVPTDAKRLTIKLENPGVGRFNAYIRFGQTVEVMGGKIIADHAIQVGFEGTATLTLEGDQFKAGSYYLAFENLEPYAQRFTLLASIAR